jgi:hypothetical protein
MTRQVSFSHQRGTRRARDDEFSVMEHYSRHASGRRRCIDPSMVLSLGGTLCELDGAYARDVVQYIFSKDGKAFPVVDHELDGEKVRINTSAVQCHPKLSYTHLRSPCTYPRSG